MGFHGARIKCTYNGCPCKDSQCGEDEPCCSCCSIIERGWQQKYNKTGYFGGGMYSSSSSSAACRYAKEFGIINGAVFIAGVACGHTQILNGRQLKRTDKVIIEGKEFMLEDSGCPDGYDSRIVNEPQVSAAYIRHEKDHGKALLQCENEIITWDDDAMVPKYLIIFKTTGDTKVPRYGKGKGTAKIKKFFKKIFG